jgi:enoyl-CoA hydratase/carnithine racemase
VRGDWRHFRYAERASIATVTFVRNERVNEVALEVYREVALLAAELARRGDEVRVLVLRGEGGGFCSGGELEVILGRLAEAEVGDAYELASVTGECVRALRQLPQPVVAAVNGVAAGPGAVLALASDIRVLSERAGFQFLFTRAGIAGADTGICWLLPRMIGLGRASELLMLGERIDSERALEFGIANRVVPDPELDLAVAAYVDRLLLAEPRALATTKDLLSRSSDGFASPRLGRWADSLLMSRSDFRDYSAGFRGRRRPTALPGRRVR